jgi:hypothetical protein
VGNNSIGDGADSALGRVVDECAAVDVGLLEVQVELLALVAGVGGKVGEDLGLQAAGEGVVELNLCRKEVGSVPRLGDADACAVLGQPLKSTATCREFARRLDEMKYIRGKRSRRVEGYNEMYGTRGNTVGQRLLALELLRAPLAIASCHQEG